MDMTPIVALLAKQSTKQLRDMEHEIQEQLVTLRLQHDLIQAALTAKMLTPAGERDTRVAPDRRGGRREIYLEIMSERPNHDWTPAEILAELTRRGLPSNGAAVRVMLRRMGEDGRIQRTPHGWKLESGDPSPEGATDGLSENGPETLSFAATGQETGFAGS